MPEDNKLDFMIEDEENQKAADGAVNDEALDSMKAELDTLKKESYGRLQDVKAERSRRQDLQGRLDNLTSIVNGVIQQQQAGTDFADPTSSGVIDLDVNDDGDIFLAKDKLAEITAPLEQKINQLEQMLQVTAEQSAQAQSAQDVINSIVGEDEKYTGAYSRYQSARKWVNDQVVNFSNDRGIEQELTSGQALDHVFNDTLEAEFKERFPNMELDRVVTAEDSQRHFRQMLDSITTASEPELGPKSDDRFKKVLQKPLGLASKGSAKSAELNVSEKLERVEPTDIMKMSDAQIEALQEALLAEERASGITF